MSVKIIYPPKDPRYRESFEFYEILDETGRLTEDPKADFLFYIIDLRIYLTGDSPHLFPLKNADLERVVVIDYSDPPEIRYIPPDIYKKVGWYFKRSVVQGSKLATYTRDVIPIHYAIRSDYPRYLESRDTSKDSDRFDVCAMFGDKKGAIGTPPEGGTRAKARDLVIRRTDSPQRVGEGERNFTGIIYDNGEGNRYGIVNRGYFDIMMRSNIIVTANPSGWEGDFRLWEALLTGNLVMCDWMVNPPPGLEHGKNIVFYKSIEELNTLLNYYGGMPEREKIGKAGREYCLQKSRFSNRVEEVLGIISQPEDSSRSSYKNKLTFGDFLEGLVFSSGPKKIVEFGILDGYSLEYFAKSGAEVDAYDIFDEFVGNKPPSDIKEKFKSYPNVSIDYGDFYKKCDELSSGEIDMIHVDIANDGDVYQFAVENYLPLLKKEGLLILEGGSQKRDDVEWMIKYSKRLIRPYLESLPSKVKWKTVGEFPSLTIIHK